MHSSLVIIRIIWHTEVCSPSGCPAWSLSINDNQAPDDDRTQCLVFILYEDTKNNIISMWDIFQTNYVHSCKLFLKEIIKQSCTDWSHEYFQIPEAYNSVVCLVQYKYFYCDDKQNVTFSGQFCHWPYCLLQHKWQPSTFSRKKWSYRYEIWYTDLLWWEMTIDGRRPSMK